jgi:dihydroorotate dehydrogenase
LNIYAYLRPLLFKLNPEQAHYFALSFLHYIPQSCFKPLPAKPVQALGMEFPHPVGLAAGLDKDAMHVDALAKLHFSFIEVGTVTPKAQLGNPKPRLFRIPEARALINRMGFNNQGAEALVKQLDNIRYRGILGINIGKNKETPLDKAAEDYLYCMRLVYERASYLTINISSPNTPDLRQLQQIGYFSQLLETLHEEQQRLADQFGRHVPLLVKVSPDESDETLKQMSEVILRTGIGGVIASNTTCSRLGISSKEQGGLSGKPLFDLSTRCLRLLKQMLGNQVTLIGVGGIDSVESAQAKLDAGASLLQIYSGLIYQGPGLVADLVKGI